MNRRVQWLGTGIAMLATGFVMHGCSGTAATSASTSSTTTIPLITPIVKSAAPAGFGGTPAAAANQIRPGSRIKPGNRTLSASDIDSRFFSSGPTDIYFILSEVDGIIGTLNSASGSCLTQTPVAYTLTPYGESVTMYGQCYYNNTSSYTGDPAYTQFGIKNNLVYFYSAAGVEHIAAIVTPLDANGNPVAVATETVTSPSASPVASSSPTIAVSPIASSYQVEIWISLGFEQRVNSTWDSGSYGVMHMVANSVTKAFELTVAGGGFGYCGAQLRSDGTNVYVTGSADMGTTCNATSSLCVLASDGTTTGTCGSTTTNFQLTALGRLGGATESPSSANNEQSGLTYGTSMYPGGTANIITLNGTSSDSLEMGPATPTTGVGQLSSQ